MNTYTHIVQLNNESMVICMPVKMTQTRIMKLSFFFFKDIILSDTPFTWLWIWIIDLPFSSASSLFAMTSPELLYRFIPVSTQISVSLYSYGVCLSIANSWWKFFSKSGRRSNHFSLAKTDRDTKDCWIWKGRRIDAYVDTRWYIPSHVKIKISISCKNIEPLAISLCPFYLPREIKHAIGVIVYIPMHRQGSSKWRHSLHHGKITNIQMCLL